MRMINGEASREMDRQAMEQYHLDTLVLMENAGLRAADYAASLFDYPTEDTRIAVVCGKGNNGGDGLVLARHLFNRGFYVEIFFTGDRDGFSPAAEANREIAEAMDIPCVFLAGERDLTLFRLKIMASSLIVDAIFGSGFKGDMRGIARDVVGIINEVHRPVFALDIPSGVDADTGKCGSTFVRADYTMAFALPKVGNILSPGGEANGTLEIADISFPRVLTEEKPEDDGVIDEARIVNVLPLRADDSHKGDYGHLLVCGGSVNMSGSVVLAAKSGLKSGAGLVTLLVPWSLYDSVAARNTEVMVCRLPEQEDGSLGLSALAPVLQMASNKVLVMGMGLTRSEESLALVKQVLDEADCPIVLDADGLMVLADMDSRKNTEYPLILTPHPGEMAKILNCSIEDVQSDRMAAARSCAEKFRAVVVLKGNRTIVAAPNGKILVNLTGNAGMATAGSGDVLAGIIGSLLGQGMEPVDAAAAGVYIHGLAGDLVAEDCGRMALNAGDLIDYLPVVLGNLEKKVKGAVE